MKTLTNIIVAFLMMLPLTVCHAQIKNTKIDTATVYGHCEMSKKAIEKAGTIEGEAMVKWDKETKLATITYDAKKTNKDEILKRIALAGFDSASFLAPEEAYKALPGCCQYNREAKTPEKKEAMGAMMQHHADKKEAAAATSNPLEGVFANYFALKDALVKTDGAAAAEKAKALEEAIGNVAMMKLEMKAHMVWMKTKDDLKKEAAQMAATKEVEKQRAHLDNLSKNIYKLMKASKSETPVYYQFCPMANDGKGANWLSKESTIKNPYFGSKMMSCGKTVETIE